MKDKVTDIETDGMPYELPKGWVWTNIEAVSEKISNGITRRQNKDGKGIPVTRIETISDGRINLKKVGYLDNLDSEIIEKYKLLLGDILFSHINSDLHLGKTAICRPSNKTLLHGMNLLLIRLCRDVINPDFFNYLCNYYRFSGFFMPIAQHAVNQSSINQTRLKKISISLPPLPEQYRIVDKIEELFTKLDAGIVSLKKVQAQLKQYRQAVLKSAVEGKLTAEWRALHKDELEPASVLLERIRKEKSKDAKYAGRLIDDDKQDTTADLPDLPDGWVWAKVGEISTVKGGKRLPKGHNYSDEPTDYPYIRVTDFDSMAVNIEQIRFLKQETQRLISRYTISKDDLYISIAGSIGKIGTIPQQLDGANLTENAAKIAEIEGFDRKFLCYFLNSSIGQEQIGSLVVSSNQPKLALFRIEKIDVPLPSLLEQQRTVEEIESRLSIADEVEAVINAELKRAERLRQSILKQAFSGKLVSQDPNDEPASVLLERIKREKGKSDNQKRNQKGNARQMKLL